MVAREQREEKKTEASSSPASIFLLYVHIHQKKEPFVGPEPCSPVNSNLTVW